MPTLRRFTALVALAVLVLAATPALATPSPDTGPGLQLGATLATWWGDALDTIVAPFASLFGSSMHTIDPNGDEAPSLHTLDPDGEPSSPQSMHTIDPNG